MPIITNGNRQLGLQIEIVGGGEEFVSPVYHSIQKVVQNFSKVVRDDALGTMAVLIQSEARANIRAGQAISQYPQTGALAASIIIKPSNGDTLKIVVGEGLPYAYLQNQPLGSTYQIVPINRQALSFKWYRHVGFNRKVDSNFTGLTVMKRVNKPGTGFFDRAVDSVRRKAPSVIRESINRYKDDIGTTTINPQTGAEVWAMGSISESVAVQRGLATITNGGLSLTPLGQRQRIRSKYRGGGKKL